MDTFVFQFVFCPEVTFDASLYDSVERGVCIDKKCIQLILRPTRDSNPWPLDWKSNALSTELAGLHGYFCFPVCFLSRAIIWYFALLQCWKSRLPWPKGYPIDTPPHKGLEPLTAGLKVQRSTDWASGATWIPLFSSMFSVPSYHLILRSIIVLNEPFASTKSVSNWYYAPKGLEPLTVGLKVQRSIDWASGATWIPLFSSLFSVRR